tara:strand:+ start:23435 stop:23701 length:267 start_codon:yes stop_codon:yes gene_type:complete
MNNKSNSDDNNRRSEENRRTEDQGQAKLVVKLQAEVAALKAELAAVPEVAPAGDDALRGLASTYAAARRNGHPDAPKHLATLLTALGV